MVATQGVGKPVEPVSCLCCIFPFCFSCLFFVVVWLSALASVLHAQGEMKIHGVPWVVVALPKRGNENRIYTDEWQSAMRPQWRFSGIKGRRQPSSLAESLFWLKMSSSNKEQQMCSMARYWGNPKT